MKLKEAFEKIVIGCIFLGGGLAFHAGASLLDFPSHDSLFQDHVQAQVAEAFPEFPTKGVHSVSIDFGKASDAASQAKWDYAIAYGGLLAGGLTLAGASLAYALGAEPRQKNDWAPPRRG